MPFNSKTEDLAVNTIKFLSADGVEKAKSGHPGLPMGAADYAYVIWKDYLNYNPQDPTWPNRDRFILSGGHGSMLLYSLLHLAGFDISMEDLQSFRQWKSNTPGHPEAEHEKGIETTTGPLGQGLSNAVGMSMASKRLGAIFNKPGAEIIDHHIYVIASDGDLMEGVSHESCALAGHLALDNIVVFYDSNCISIEGSTELAYSDDVRKRFEGYHWHVQEIDGHDRQAAADAIEKAKAEKGKPSIIIANTCIGKGAPTKQGTAGIHGEPLGEEELNAAKEAAGWPMDKPFYVPDEVRTVWQEAASSKKPKYDQWQEMFAKYCKENPDMKEKWDAMMGKEVPSDITERLLNGVDCAKDTATRASSGLVIQEAVKHVPALWGGSADLSPSNKSDLKNGGDFSADDRLGFNIHFGVREHGMGSAVNGMALYGGVIPYAATFFVFSDYMRPTIRLAAIMKQQVIYVFTHDSIFVGEDGPTHEPIEHLSSLRAMPDLNVFRPANTSETAVAWASALERKDGPTALVLSRQNTSAECPAKDVVVNAKKGAYVVKAESNPDVVIIATGSEVATSMDAAAILADKGVKAQVVSMPCMELFDEQDQAYKDSVIPPSVSKRVAVEVACSWGWHKYIGWEGMMIGMDRYGESAPWKTLAKEFGFTPEAVAEKVEKYVK